MPIQCTRCDDTGMVCEDHKLPMTCESNAPNACDDCGVGMPCPDCTTPVPQFQGHSITDNFIPRARKH